MFDPPLAEVEASPTSTDVLWMRIESLSGLRALRRLGKTHAGPFVLALCAALVLGDYLTDIRRTFVLLFLVPVTLAAWWRGRGLGLASAVLCASGAAAIDVLGHLQRGHALRAEHLLWNHGGSLVVLVVIVLLVDRVRARATAEAAARRLVLEELRQMDRLGVVGKLAAGIAHELGTPLNVIVGHAEMLKSARPQDPMVQASSATVRRQAEKMTKIIRGLLDFSRSSLAERSEIDLDELASGASEVLRPLARVNGVDIDVSSRGSKPALVQGSHTELEQVLVNLIMNGIQAMPKGGTLHVRVNPRANPAGEPASAPSVACVEVEDQGVGISPANLPKIFDPFFTTKDVGEGTGLGLSVSYGIVSDHGGRIQVTSAVGLGTRFSVYLPLSHSAR